MAFTYFFRDMQTLETIRDHAIPSLRMKRHIKIWDAGCAMGPEPYSLAIVLRENMGSMIFRNVRIFATDIDGSNLFKEIIEKGEYPEDQVKRIPGHILAKYFTKIDDSSIYKISSELSRCVQFSKHDLLSLEPIQKDFSLILCKNVLLHFSYEERIEVVKMFHENLIEGGFLATEQTQKMLPELNGYFEQVIPSAQLFRKTGPSGV